MITQSIRVDFGHSHAVPGILRASQGDTGERAFSFLCFHDSKLTEIAEGSAVILIGHKPGGHTFTKNCTFSGSEAFCGCEVAMTDTAGEVRCELQIITENGTASSENFKFIVEASPVSADGMKKSDFESIEGFTESAWKAAKEAKQAAGSFSVADTLTETGETPVKSKGIFEAISKAVESLRNLISQKQDRLTFDAVPKATSTNPVTSKGIFEALRNKLDADHILNNLLTQNTDGYALDARQGYALDKKIRAVKAVTDAVPVIKSGVNDGISGVFTGFLTGGGKEIYINFPVIRGGYGLSFTNADKIYIRQNGNYLWDTDNSGEEATKLKMEFEFTDALPCGWIVIKRADGKAFANGTNNDVVAVQIGKMTLFAAK